MLGVEVHMPEEYPPQYPNQPYPGQPSPYQQFAAPAPQPAPYYGGPGGYQNSFFYEQSRQQMEGGKHATNGVVLGCIGTFCAVCDTPAAGTASTATTASRTMDGRIQERGTVTPPSESLRFEPRS